MSKSILPLFTSDDDDKNFHQPFSVDDTTSYNLDDLYFLFPIKNILLILYFSFLSILITKFNALPEILEIEVSTLTSKNLRHERYL